MKFALVNPNWSFEGSIYFGCREPHLPLEYGYSKHLLEQAGHEALIVDAQLENLPPEALKARVADFVPHFTVVCTAPSYLFWRCAPPELRVPRQTMRNLREVGGLLVGVGPHCSTTPKTSLRKLNADVVIIGECEEILPRLTGSWADVPSICYWAGEEPRAQGPTHSCDMTSLPALHCRPNCWPGIGIITTGSKRNRLVPEQRWRPLEAAPTIAPSAPRITSAISIAAVPWRLSCPRWTVCSRMESSTSIS